jgi:hypothetical protein
MQVFMEMRASFEEAEKRWSDQCRSDPGRHPDIIKRKAVKVRNFRREGLQATLRGAQHNEDAKFPVRAYTLIAFNGLGEADCASKAEDLQTAVRKKRQEARRYSSSRYPESSEPGYPRESSLVALLALVSR